MIAMENNPSVLGGSATIDADNGIWVAENPSKNYEINVTLYGDKESNSVLLLTDGSGNQNLFTTGFGAHRVPAFRLNMTTSALSLDNVNQARFSLYPNPTTGIAYVDATEIYVGSTLTVHDMTGRLLSTKTIIAAGQQEINVGHTPGVYLVTLTTRTGKENTFKIQVR